MVVLEFLLIAGLLFTVTIAMSYWIFKSPKVKNKSPKTDEDKFTAILNDLRSKNDDTIKKEIWAQSIKDVYPTLKDEEIEEAFKKAGLFGETAPKTVPLDTNTSSAWKPSEHWGPGPSCVTSGFFYPPISGVHIDVKSPRKKSRKTIKQ